MSPLARRQDDIPLPPGKAAAIAAIAIGLTGAAALLTAVAPATAVADSAPQVFTGIVRGVAVGGYDPVAYFTAGRPVRGEKTITLDHAGATWRFANEANRAAFASKPEKYAPAYGGHCAWAVSRGYAAKGDPKAWKIVGDRLFLNYNHDVQATWQKALSRNVARADENWPKLTGTAR